MTRNIIIPIKNHYLYKVCTAHSKFYSISRNAMKIVKLLSLAALLGTGCASAPKTQTAVYLDPSRPIEERVEDALARLTVKEKIGLIHAQSKFSSAGVPRLGIPEIWCTDGPHGIRPEV